MNKKLIPHTIPSIQKNKYDAHYVINLCKQIISKCQNNILNANDFRMTLQISLKRLISEIEVEMMQNPNIPKVFKCDDCNEIYFTLPNNIKVECPHCCKSVKKIE